MRARDAFSAGRRERPAAAVTAPAPAPPARALAWLRAGRLPARLPPAWAPPLAGAAGLGFLALTVAVLGGGTLAIDDRIDLGVHAYASPSLSVLMQALTLVGLIPTVTALVIAAGLLLVRARRRLEAVFLVGVMLGEGALDDLVKIGVRRPRPRLFPHPALSGFSYPSGHAMATVCLAGVLLLVAWPHLGRRWRRILGLTAPVLLLGIGLSRVYLGVHDPSDVVGGWLAGCAWLGAAFAWLRRWSLRHPPTGREG